MSGINGVNRYSYYSMLLKSPFSPAETSPNLNMLYGASVTALYSSKLNQLSRREMSTYLQSFNTNISSLKTSSKNLTSSASTNVFNERSATASDKNIVAAQASANAEKKAYVVKVEKVAQAQVNNTAKLDSNAFTSFTPGTNTFSVTSGTKTTTVDIDVKSYYSNRDVLREVSSKLNSSGSGITSELVEESGKSWLKMTSTSTGAQSTFTLADVSGDFVSRSQSNTVAQASRDASYTVDGTGHTSASNNVKLDNGKVSLTLKAAGESKVTIADNPESILSSVKSFAGSFNDNLSYLNSHMTNKNVSQLRNNLVNSVKLRDDNLESIGINVDQDGSLSVDEDKFSSAWKSNSEKVKSVLGGSSGVATRINRLTEEAAVKPSVSFMDFQTYSSSANGYANMYNYVNTAQKQYLAKTMQQGALFDMTL